MIDFDFFIVKIFFFSLISFYLHIPHINIPMSWEIFTVVLDFGYMF